MESHTSCMPRNNLRIFTVNVLFQSGLQSEQTSQSRLSSLPVKKPIRFVLKGSYCSEVSVGISGDNLVPILAKTRVNIYLLYLGKHWCLILS